MPDDLERQLRELGTAELAAVGAPPAWDGPTTPSRWLVPAVAAAAVVAVAVGTAATTGVLRSNPPPAPVATPTAERTAEPAPTVAPPVHVVPWRALPAGPDQSAVALPTPPLATGVAPCRAADLRVERGSRDGATSAVLEHFLVRLKGTTPCLLDARLQRLSGKQAGTTTDVPLIGNGVPGTAPGVLTPDTPGGFTLYVGGRCDTQDMVRQEPLTALRVGLLGGEIAVEPAEGGAELDLRCGPDVSATTVGVRPPEVQYADDPRQRLRAQLEVPVEVRAGEVLRYQVVLSNPTTAVVDLTPCPSYNQTLPLTAKRFQLNCAAAIPVPAQGTEVFLMELSVPDTTPPGPTRVSWFMGGFQLPLAHADVIVLADRSDEVGPEAQESTGFLKWATGLRLNPVRWLSGKQAEREAAARGTDVSNDYLIVDDEATTYSLRLAPGCRIVGDQAFNSWATDRPYEPGLREVRTVEELEAFVRSGQAEHVLWELERDGSGAVIRVAERWRP